MGSPTLDPPALTLPNSAKAASSPLIRDPKANRRLERSLESLRMCHNCLVQKKQIDASVVVAIIEREYVMFMLCFGNMFQK